MQPNVYKSFKSKRVTRSVLGAETLAFAEAFDCVYVLKVDLENSLGQKTHMRMLMDSSSLFDVFTKNSTTTEKRLMIDVAAAREAYKSFEISDFGNIRSQPLYKRHLYHRI